MTKSSPYARSRKGVNSQYQSLRPGSEIRLIYKEVLGGSHADKADPQPKNPKGEAHEEWGFMSFDKARKTFVLRQFHVEGFVNEFVLSSSSADAKTMVFTTESIENIPAGFRARETYKILGADEFTEVFEIAEPGKDFELYSEAHFRRKK